MNSKMDPMGRAIADYWKTMVSTNRPKKASKLRVFSPMFEEDEIPLATLFRSYESMPEIERMALDMAKGRVLDVGAGSGCHSLVLQERGIDVTAIDISPLSVEAMKERGLKKVYEQDFFTLDGQAMEQREPSSLLEWPSRDRGRRSQRERFRPKVKYYPPRHPKLDDPGVSRFTRLSQVSSEDDIT